MYPNQQTSVQDSIFARLSQELKDSPAKYNYIFNKEARKNLINKATWYLLGCDNRLSDLIVIDEKTGGAPREENQEKNIELIEYTEVKRGQLCGHVFRRGEDDTCVLCTRCFRASDHSGHDFSFSINSGTGGCCDCGDKEAWKHTLFCGYHATLKDLDEQGIKPIIKSNGILGIPGYDTDQVPDTLIQSFKGAIRAVLEFMLITFSTSPTPNNKNLDIHHITEDVHRMNSILGDNSVQKAFAIVLWNDETHSFQGFIDVLEVALDCRPEVAKMMIKSIDSHGRDVIAISKSIPDLLRIAEYMKRVSLNVSIRSAREVFREQLAASLLIWLRDVACFKFRALVKICNGNANLNIRTEICNQLSSKWEEFETNSFLFRYINSEFKSDDEDDDNFDECVIAPDIDPNIQSDMASSSKVFGETTRDLHHKKQMHSLHSYSNSGMGNDMGLTNRNGQDIYRGQRRQRSDSMERAFDEDYNSHPSGSRPLSTNLSSSTLRPIHKLGSVHRSTASNSKQKQSLIGEYVNIKSMEKLWNNSEVYRLDWFLMVDLQLWKEVRGGLRELYMATMMLDQKFKTQMAISFGRNYPRLTKAFLTQDQGPEHSVLLFSVQLFTVPTLSQALVREYGFLYTVLRMLKRFFIKPTPKDLRRHGVILCDTESFRNRRYFHIFHDMRYLASASSVPEWIASEKQFFNAYLGFISLFQGMSPNRRARVDHIEFEDDTWVHAFNVTLQVAKSCRQLADCYVDRLNDLTLAIRGTLRKIENTVKLLAEENISYILNSSSVKNEQSYLSQNSEDTEYIPFSMHERSTMWGKTYNIVKYSISRHPVSFHHPLHWFLANLFRHINLLEDEMIQKAGYSNLQDLLFTYNRPDLDNGSNNGFADAQMAQMAQISLLRAVDYSIRVIVLMGQIRARMWVRNGYVVKSQAHHYREISLRENTYDQDIFLIQFFLCVWPDPDQILVSIVDRFELHEWFRGNMYGGNEGSRAISDLSQYFELVDEFLITMIVIVSDRDVTSGKSSQELSRREIVHGCLSMTSYSELAKKIPERLAEHAKFDAMLLELASYRAPISVQDTGMYELKDEYLEEVNPHFIHYSRNQREEVEELLLSRIKKYKQKRGITDDESDSPPIIIPKLVQIEKGPFKTLGMILHSPYSCQILFFSLYNIAFTGNKILSTAIIDQTLYLIIIALSDGSKGHIAQRLGYGKDEGCGGLWKHAVEQVYKFNFGEICLLGLIMRLRCQPEMENWKHSLDFILKLFEKGSKSTATWIFNYTQVLISQGIMSTENKQDSIKNKEERKKEVAKTRQAQLMADFAKAQKNFMETFGEEFDDLSGEDDDGHDTIPAKHQGKQLEIDLDDSMDKSPEPNPENMECEGSAVHDQLKKMDTSDPLSSTSLKLLNMGLEGHKGKSQFGNDAEINSKTDIETKSSKVFKFNLGPVEGNCIVCQESCDSLKPHGMLALIQQSFILRQAPLNSTEHILEIIDQPLSQDTIESRPIKQVDEASNSDNMDLVDGELEDLIDGDNSDSQFSMSNQTSNTEDMLYLYNNTGISLGAPSGLSAFPARYRERGVFATSCGHMMHQTCFERYCHEVKIKHQRQPTRNHAECLDRHEFLCPLCNSLGNFLLPVLSDTLADPELKECGDLFKFQNVTESVSEKWLNEELSALFTKMDDLANPKSKNSAGGNSKIINSQSNFTGISGQHLYLSPEVESESLNPTESLINNPTTVGTASGVPIQNERVNNFSSQAASGRMFVNNLMNTVSQTHQTLAPFSIIPSNLSFQNLNNLRNQLTEMLNIRWPLEFLRQSPQRIVDGWNTIKQKMLGNVENHDAETDINEWRMLIPIYLYLFATLPEWHSHIAEVRQVLKPKSQTQETNNESQSNSTSGVKSSQSSNGFNSFLLNSDSNSQASNISNGQPYFIPPTNNTSFTDGQTNTDPTTFVHGREPAYNEVNEPGQRIDQNMSESHITSRYMWSRIRPFTPAVSQAMAGSPPWPGHSGVTIQSIPSRNPDIGDSRDMQNDSTAFDMSLLRLTGLELSLHANNEQFQGKDLLLSQLSSYKAIYEQLFSVLKTVEQDKMIGLPNYSVFNHLYNAGVAYKNEMAQQRFRGSMLRDFDEAQKELLSPSNNSHTGGVSSEISSNPESVDNDMSRFRTTQNLDGNGVHPSQATILSDHQNQLARQQNIHSNQETASGGYSEPYLNFRSGVQFLQSIPNTVRSIGVNMLTLPDLPLPEPIIAAPSHRDFNTFPGVLPSDNDVDMAEDPNNSIPNIDFEQISSTNPNMFEQMVSNLLAQNIMCLDVSSKGRPIPRALDQDDPRKESPSGTWLDSVSANQFMFTSTLFRFAQTQYRLLLSDTTSITEYCSSLDYEPKEPMYGNKRRTLVTDAATSLAMVSVRHSVLSSLKNTLEPLRPTNGSDQRSIPQLQFPTGIDENKLPNKPFLMKDAFTQFVDTSISVGELFDVDRWQLVRLFFVVELIRTCIAVGDSVVGNYAGANVNISSTLCPLSFTSTGKYANSKRMSEILTSGDPGNQTKLKWPEDPLAHKETYEKRFESLYEAFKLLDGGYKGSMDDLNLQICHMVAWTQTMLVPNSMKCSPESQMSFLLNVAPKYSVSLLVAQLLTPFMRRVSAFLVLSFGLTHPSYETLKDLDGVDAREFISLWQFLRLPSPLVGSSITSISWGRVHYGYTNGNAYSILTCEVAT
ncbi:hypothetical protein BB558_002700 [Smittium angustum]|uniref:E3 ubiquitin-protein ligase n=1 Tax=Smittium angustum TaxID=133377 RepID=A0A2U1J813_SMIAN|nr:hypothetical protein BB558_002700 [Smittium angustum]